MDIEAGFDKEVYFMKQILGRGNLEDIQRVKLSAVLESYSKKDLEEFLSDLTKGEIACLKGQSRNFITTFVNIQEHTEAENNAEVEKETAKQTQSLKEIKEMIEKIKDRKLRESVGLTLCIGNQYHGEELNASEEVIKAANEELMFACFGVPGLVLLGTFLAAITTGIPPGLIVLGFAVSIGALVLAVHASYKSKSELVEKNCKPAEESKGEKIGLSKQVEEKNVNQKD